MNIEWNLDQLFVNNIVYQVDQKIRWKKDEGVTLNFTGKAPDIGAFEFE